MTDKPLEPTPLTQTEVAMRIGALTLDVAALRKTVAQYVERERELLAEIARLTGAPAEPQTETK